MKKLSECETFVKPENRITLEYASKDKESGGDVYMTHSQIMVTDFDKVKDEYTNVILFSGFTNVSHSDNFFIIQTSHFPNLAKV